MSAAFCFTSRASLRIALFLPEKPDATCVQRCCVSAASCAIRSSVATRSSLLPRVSCLTFFAESFAAIARPVTSASFSSSTVSSAIWSASDSWVVGCGRPAFPRLALRNLAAVLPVTEATHSKGDLDASAHRVGHSRSPPLRSGVRREVALHPGRDRRTDLPHQPLHGGLARTRDLLAPAR